MKTIFLLALVFISSVCLCLSQDVLTIHNPNLSTLTLNYIYQVNSSGDVVSNSYAIGVGLHDTLVLNLGVDRGVNWQGLVNNANFMIIGYRIKGVQYQSPQMGPYYGSTNQSPTAPIPFNAITFSPKNLNQIFVPIRARKKDGTGSAIIKLEVRDTTP